MRQELKVITGLGCSILLSGFALLGITQDSYAAGQWLLQAGLLWAGVCWYVLRLHDLNRATAGSALYSSLGWGNRLTILRGGLIALVGGFLYLNPAISVNVLLPAAFYTLAAVFDRLDGYVARRSKQVSLLGNQLDIAFDALGLVVAPLLAISWGKIHVSYLLLSVAYYVYQWGLLSRQQQGLPCYALPENSLRRTLAGFQMGFIAVALWPVLNPRLTSIASVAFMLPVLFGFVMDWWVVSGRIPARVYSAMGIWSEQVFQPVLRVLVILCVILMTRNTNLFINDPLLFFEVLGTASLILFGYAGRLGSLLLILLLGWGYPAVGSNASDYLLISTASWILLLGTGKYSIWHWGDDWLNRYAGA
jgi:CDP-diacylglycerol--glycerol-3-phosphate 3-phosphatidyltransferase